MTQTFTRSGHVVFADHLATWSEDPVGMRRLSRSIQLVREALDRATSRKDATSKGYRNDSLPMRIRQFHNEMGLHVHRLCAMALYRSVGVLEIEREGRLSSADIRCEHVVPATVVAGLLWDRFRDAPIEDIAEFLLCRTFVAALTRQEDKELLTIPRSYGKGEPEAWKATHPEYLEDLDPGREDLRPFLRYHGTGLRIVAMPTGREIDLETWTLRDHQAMIAGLPLFDAGRLDLHGSFVGRMPPRRRAGSPTRTARRIGLSDEAGPVEGQRRS